MQQIARTKNFHGLGDAQADALTLQLAANRYAAAVGKAPLETDGQIGPLTLAMVKAALQHLVTKNVSAATAAGLLAKVATVAQLQASASGMATFLNDSMDAIKASTYRTEQFQRLLTIPLTKLPAGSAPGVNPSAPAQTIPGAFVLPGTTPTPSLVMAASAPSAIVGLAPVGKIALAVGAGLVALIVLKRLL